MLITLATIMIQYPTGIILLLKWVIIGFRWGFRAGDHTLGKLVLYMLNLINSLTVIVRKSDIDFTGVSTSTRFVLIVSPDRAGLLMLL